MKDESSKANKGITKRAYKRTCPKCGATEKEYVRRVTVYCGLCWDKFGEDKAPKMVYEFIRMVTIDK